MSSLEQIRKGGPLFFDGKEVYTGPTQAELADQRSRDLGLGPYNPQRMIPSMLDDSPIAPEMEAFGHYLFECMMRESEEDYDQQVIDEFEALQDEVHRRLTPPKWRFLARRRFDAGQEAQIVELNI